MAGVDVKIDLEELERKAIAARDEHRTEESLIVTEKFAEHIVATEPPIVLALIARIRELGDALENALDAWNRHDEFDTQASDRTALWRVLEKGTVLT